MTLCWPLQSIYYTVFHCICTLGNNHFYTFVKCVATIQCILYGTLTVKASKVSLSFDAIDMTAQVWLNPLASLSYGEVMIDYVINDCCPNFIRASYVNATQGPLYFYYG